MRGLREGSAGEESETKGEVGSEGEEGEGMEEGRDWNCSKYSARSWSKMYFASKMCGASTDASICSARTSKLGSAKKLRTVLVSCFSEVKVPNRNT